MSLPQVLLVDDSDAILTYETAALSAHYAVSTAKTGVEAMRKIQQLRPAAVLLDLSMPEMDGDEVLSRMAADPELRQIPVIIVSSENRRAEACLKAGAVAYLPKPIRADELRATVGRVLSDARGRREKSSLGVVFVSVGPLELGIPLAHVVTIVLQPATKALPAGPAYLCEMFELHGEPVCVLDLAEGLGVAYAEPVEERKLVVVAHASLLIALSVDGVQEPEVFEPDQVIAPTAIGGAQYAPLNSVLHSVARTSRGLKPVIEPLALFSQSLLEELPLAIQRVRAAEPAQAG